MAQVLWGLGTAASMLATDVAAMLGEAYIVLAGALPRRVRVDVLVLGPRGLYALHACDWSGEIRPSRRGSWRVRLASGQVCSRENPGARVRLADKALHAFLRDEFPALHLPVYHILVFTDVQARPLATAGYGLLMASAEDLATEIAALEFRRPDVAGLPQLQALARALSDGRLTRRQRAWAPYTCPTGGTFGPGLYWTIDQVLRHLDRHPDDGARHLLDGSLERWLREQGAKRLAELARGAARHAALEPRAALEEFLTSTGYLEKPRLTMRPRRLDLGYIVAGEAATAWLQLRKGRGRGYLHGVVTSEAPFVTVEPDIFFGDTDLRIKLETASLRLDARPCEASLELRANAWPEPIRVPVTFRLRSEPPAWVRRALLPLSGALLGALFGLVLGWVSARWGLPFPGRTAIQPTASAWLLVLGGYGALVGLVRGRRQNAAWPLGQAALRWSARVALRAISRAGAALALLGLVFWLSPLLQHMVSGASIVTFLALLAAAGLVPATVEQLRAEGMIVGRERPFTLPAPLPSSQVTVPWADRRSMYFRHGEGEL